MRSPSWISSPRSRALLGAALVLSLVLGTALIVVDRHEADAVQRHFASMTDEQAAAQVVGAARTIVSAAHLRDATGGYTFVPCGDEDLSLIHI